MSGHGEIVSILHSLSFDAKDATNGPPPSVETLIAEGKTRLKEWEEKNKAKQTAAGAAAGSGSGGSAHAASGDPSSSVPAFTAAQFEATTPAATPGSIS